MRGSPILRALAALIVLLALGYPLHRFTAAAGSTPKSAQKAAAAAQVVHLQISFTQPPRQLRVLSLGEPVWTETSPAAQVERDIPMAYPEEGVELQFDLDWPDGSGAAARVTLTDPAGTEHTGFVWAKGATTEVLTFH